MLNHEDAGAEQELPLEELLQAVQKGCDILISQAGTPLAHLVIPPIRRIIDFSPEEEDPFYAVVIEKRGSGYAAYVPDLPDCIATAETEEEVEDLIREAMRWHLDALNREGAPLPDPITRAVYVQAARLAAA